MTSADDISSDRSMVEGSGKCFEELGSHDTSFDFSLLPQEVTLPFCLPMQMRRRGGTTER